jgi:Iap family predicted aminopeptidase
MGKHIDQYMRDLGNNMMEKIDTELKLSVKEVAEKFNLPLHKMKTTPIEHYSKDLEEYKATMDWNSQGFEEVYRILGQLEDFTEEYNNRGKFRMKIKDTDESKKLILVINLEK